MVPLKRIKKLLSLSLSSLLFYPISILSCSFFARLCFGFVHVFSLHTAIRQKKYNQLEHSERIYFSYKTIVKPKKNSNVHVRTNNAEHNKNGNFSPEKN